MAGRRATAPAVLLVALIAFWATAIVVTAGEDLGNDVGRRFHERGQAETTPDVVSIARPQFQTSDNCMACHNGLVTPAGEDVSIGADWRASMMGNSARDPYWMAAVRRELIDHPQAQAAIEDECTICHMPMTTFPARAAGGKGRLFDYLPGGRAGDADVALAADGVSCTVCHQLSANRLGNPATFTGKYGIDVGHAGTGRVPARARASSGRSRSTRAARA